MFLTKFEFSWPFGSGEEAKNIFSRWQPYQPSWISNQNNLSYFNLLVTPMLHIKFQNKWPSIQEKKRKIDFQDGGHGGHLVFPIPRCFLPSFMSIGRLFQEKKQNIDFQDGSYGGHLGFRI